MPWYPPTRLEAEAAAQFLAAILEAQQRYGALSGEDDAGPGGGPHGAPHRGDAPGRPDASGPPPDCQTGPSGTGLAPCAFIGFEHQLPVPPPRMSWVEGVMGTYVAVPTTGSPAGSAPVPARVPVPSSTGASSGERAHGARSGSRAPTGAAPSLGSRPGAPGAASAPAAHPDFPGHTPLALYQALLGRTRMHHAILREQMTEFEDWLDGMALFFSGPDGA